VHRCICEDYGRRKGRKGEEGEGWGEAYLKTKVQQVPEPAP
jgi:hypothetical protein